VIRIWYVREHAHIREPQGSIEQLGSLRVNGAAASLSAPVTAGATILFSLRALCGSLFAAFPSADG